MANGYQIPKTIDELKALAARMQADGLNPIGFADKDGWPAMGTFDQLNMRLNGYDFHIGLMAYKQSWTDPKVKAVFDLWKSLLPYHQPGANGRTWQEAAQDLGARKSGMYLLGSFVAQQFTGADLDDLDFFAFPGGASHPRATTVRKTYKRHDVAAGQAPPAAAPAAGGHRRGRGRRQPFSS